MFLEKLLVRGIYMFLTTKAESLHINSYYDGETLKLSGKDLELTIPITLPAELIHAVLEQVENSPAKVEAALRYIANYLHPVVYGALAMKQKLNAKTLHAPFFSLDNDSAITTTKEPSNAK